MSIPLRKAGSWALLALTVARLLVSPGQLSTPQLLTGASYSAGLLGVGWLLWFAFALYFIPMNRIRVSDRYAD